MPAKKTNLSIKLDLLKPQSRHEKLPVKFLRWLLSYGRYTFIFVEALVLIAFITRFKLDADLASRKEAIDQQIPFIESLRSDEILMRQVQLKLSAISAFYSNIPDYPQILRMLANQTPQGVKIASINLEKGVDKSFIRISAQAQNNIDLMNFIEGLKEDGNFTAVNLVSIGLDQGSIRFSISLEAKISQKETEGRSL